MTGTGARGPAMARLRVLHMLPQAHQDYFFAEVRKLCTQYVGSLRISASKREMFSEVMAKLLGAAGSSENDVDDAPALPTLLPHEDPKRDGRVAWLLSEIGGRQALTHRQEDIRRWLYGRREGGYRLDQLENEHLDIAVSEPTGLQLLEERDHGLIWRGVLIAAGTEFSSGEDVSRLVHLMASDDDIQVAFGTRWPVNLIVDALNRLYPHPPWTDDRVENAKKRLTSWIDRLRRTRGLDPTDLADLFARLARGRDKVLKPAPQRSPAVAKPSVRASAKEVRP